MCLLHYVYTGELDLSPEIVGQVIACAGQLKMLHLMSSCANYLSKNLKPSTAVLFYSIAANHNFKHIYNAAFKIIVDDFLELSKTSHFCLLPVDRSEQHRIVIVVVTVINVLQNHEHYYSGINLGEFEGNIL